MGETTRTARLELDLREQIHSVGVVVHGAQLLNVLLGLCAQDLNELVILRSSACLFCSVNATQIATAGAKHVARTLECIVESGHVGVDLRRGRRLLCRNVMNDIGDKRRQAPVPLLASLALPIDLWWLSLHCAKTNVRAE